MGNTNKYASNPSLTPTPGSNPGLQGFNSAPALQVVGSNPALQVSGSNPSMNLIMTSSNSSISSVSGVHRRSPILPIMITFLLFVTIAMIAAGAYHAMKTVKNQREEVARLEQQEKEVKHVNAQPIRQLNDYDGESASDDERSVIFSLFTTPEGAAVYKDGFYLDTTPIDDLKLEKADANAHFVLYLEGYEAISRDFSLSENHSDSFTLEPVEVVDENARAANDKPVKIGEGITTNKAMVISDTTKPSKASKRDKAKKAAPTFDIALPD